MKLSFLSLIISLFIGGVITGNILGDMKQKTAEIVFYMWKGIQVFRKKVSPANPNTAPQQGQRLFFKNMVIVSQALLLSVIQPFWKKYAIKKSEYNAFMSHNMNNVSYPINYLNLILCKGSIAVCEIIDAVYTSLTGSVDISWDKTLEGTQELTDISYAAVYVPSNNFWYVNVLGSITRNSEALKVTIIAGLTGSDITDCVAYLWFSDVAFTEPVFNCSTSDSINVESA